MNQNSGKRFRFGAFEADLPAGELRKNGKVIRLQVQPFQVLVALLERPGEVVTRDELRARLWPEESFGDFDQGLNTAINKLREALGDSAVNPRFVETLPKRGYRFTFPLEQETAKGRGDSALAPASGKKRKYAWLAASFALLATLLGVAMVRREPEGAQSPFRRFAIRLPVPVAAAPTWASAAAISPDGRHIAFVSEGGSRRLWIQDLDQESPRVLEGTEGAWRPFWAPDSTAVGFGVAGELRKVPLRGGPVIRLCRECTRSFFGGAWSPDGRSIVFSDGAPASLYEIPSTGGVPRLLRSWEHMQHQDSTGIKTPAYVFSPHFLPAEAGGRTIVFSFGYPAATLVVQNLDTGREIVIAPGSNAVYSRTGHLLYQSRAAAAEIWALPLSLQRLSPTGEPFRVARSAIDPTVASDGTLVYRDAGSQRLIWRDRRGTQVGSIGAPVDGVFYPALSPDGRSVAVETLENGTLDIWVYNLERGARARLTAHPATDIVPVWSPAGDVIAFSSYRSGNIDILTRKADGSGDTETLAATPRNERVSDWSRDGRYILYSIFEPKNGFDIWYMERKEHGAWESHPLLQSASNEIAARLSPDGRYFAYVSDETGREEVYVRSFPSGNRKWSVSAHGGRQIRWRRDGRELFYVEAGALIAVPVRATPEFAPGPAVRLFSSGSWHTWFEANYDVSAEGMRFLLPERLSGQDHVIHLVQNWFAEFRMPFSQTSNTTTGGAASTTKSGE
jgi:Tol biopolymer transport system component/DNA-binding winged helix-turn-helix (wHTH) protein